MNSDRETNARIIVEESLKVRPKEKVLIISESENRQNAETLAHEVHRTGGIPLIIDASLQVKEGLQLGLGTVYEPPDDLAAAIRNADVNICATPYEFYASLAHSQPMMDALKTRARQCGLEIPIGEPEIFAEWEIMVEDLRKIKETTEKIDRVIRNADVHLTTRKGTNLRIKTPSSRLGANTPYAHERGMVADLPFYAESSGPCVEGTGNGVIVVDGATYKIGVDDSPAVPKEPIELSVREGKVIDINGGEEAKKLQRILASGDEWAKWIGEFSPGTSFKEKVPGRPLISEKGALGTLHFSLGSNDTEGGKIHSNTHIDAVIREIRLEVNGRVIIENNQCLI